MKTPSRNPRPFRGTAAEKARLDWKASLARIEQSSYDLLTEKRITVEELRPHVIQAVLEMVNSLCDDAAKNGSSADVVKWIGHAWGGPEDAHSWLIAVIEKLGK